MSTMLENIHIRKNAYGYYRFHYGSNRVLIDFETVLGYGIKDRDLMNEFSKSLDLLNLDIIEIMSFAYVFFEENKDKFSPYFDWQQKITHRNSLHNPHISYYARWVGHNGGIVTIYQTNNGYCVDSNYYAQTEHDALELCQIITGCKPLNENVNNICWLPDYCNESPHDRIKRYFDNDKYPVKRWEDYTS